MALKRALPPVHPGEILREDVLPALDLSVMDAAEKLGITRQTLHRIIARENPRPVTPDMAVRLGKLCGNGPRFWANLQSAYDLWHAASTRAESRRCTRRSECMNPLDPSASPDDELAREVYAHFGLCMYIAQVFETGLINILTVLEVAAVKPTSQREQEVIFNSLYAKHEALTFGNLLRALSKHIFVPSKLMEEAKALKAERDHLAHRFFRDHDLDFVTVGGCYSMIENLELRRTKFSELDQKISGLLDRAYEASGQSAELKAAMEKIEAEMLDEARARYRSAI